MTSAMFVASSTIEVDDFTARLFKIHQQILKEGRSQVWDDQPIKEAALILEFDAGAASQTFSRQPDWRR